MSVADMAGKPATGKSVAVIGAGWAGCAAAVELARAGCKVTLFEAARVAGGRARRIETDQRRLDNGQHILLGAYRATLELMRTLGVDPAQALLTLPLQMRYPAESDGMTFVAPRWPAPLHLLGALLRAKGLKREDKLSLARFSTTARWMGWRLHKDCSVAELLERFDQTPRLVQLMWRPLCLAALNTPPERASAQVFLNVLRDSLGASRRASDMLLPRVDLSALLPEAAQAYVLGRGGAVRCGAKVRALQLMPDGQWRVDASGDAVGGNWSAYVDGVVLATGASQAATLLHGIPGADAASAALCQQLTAFEPEAITTCYLQFDTGVRLDQPFYALVDDPEQHQWGQFVFDRGQLDPAQAGLMAVVISASAPAAAQEQALLAEALAVHLAVAFQRPELGTPRWFKVITEKRATFACTPGLLRPGNATGLDRLVLAGDYTAAAAPDEDATYPATLESAVRSGIAAAAMLWQPAATPAH